MGGDASHLASKQVVGTTGAGSSAEVQEVIGTIAHLITRQYYMERSVETHAIGGELATTGAILTTAGAIAHQGAQEIDKYLLGLTLFYALPLLLVLLLVL